MPRISIAFIGLGGIASQAHLPAIKELGFNVDFCVDVDEQRVRSFTEKTGCKGYSDYKEMLENENLDAVLIATPNIFHATIAVEALKNGAHVYIEKPMATNIEEALKIVDAAYRVSKFAVVGHNGRFDYKAHTAAKLIHRGNLGRVYHARGFILRQRGIPPAPTFIKKSLAKGGAVYDIASHAIDMLLYLSGYPKPVSVKGFTYRAFGDRVEEFGMSYPQPPQPGMVCEVEDFGSAYISFDGGAGMYVEVSWASYVKENKVEYIVLGERGGIQIDGTSLSYVTSLEREFFVASPPSIPQVNSYREAWRRFLNAIENNDEALLCPIATAEQGVIDVTILASIYESSLIGKEVKIDVPNKLVERAREQLKCLKL
ncbi:MAG: Gfo/Idh/MocA family oxidoreductase [Ignisphaera sp.]|nr:Gfo/Idh/MocA family oxidoreductase [Ignisphaera sp.]MCX8167838.1 Gfo/Idh/MocA family oxidoreductase [Ignisphaera sp.]MDW8085797.1 Gfo/Idh/MocA family oxidoreductase [Ignisphaera sp.]